MPQMADPNFAQTVVLLCDYTEKGAFGLVVNRQMEEPAWTMVKTDPPVKVDPEVRLEREPITDANRDDALAGGDLTEEEHEVTLHAEEPVVEKRVVPKERVRLDKDTVTEDEPHHEPASSTRTT